MTLLERRAIAIPSASAGRSAVSVAGVALMASVAFLFHHIAPGAPALLPIGLACRRWTGRACLGFHSG